MALSDWLAAIGGGAAAIDQAKTDDEKRQLEEKRIAATETNATIRADVQRMLGELNAGSRERIAGQNNDTKREISGDTNRTRQTIADLNDVGRTTRATSAESGRNRRADQSNATVVRGQDMGDSHYWDQAARDYYKFDAGDATRRRGQDMSQATTERGQDLGADSSDAGRRTRAALGVLSLQQRGENSLLGDDNANWADRFDKLYSDPASAATTAVDAANAPAATPAPRPRVPVKPRGTPAAAPNLESQARMLIDKIRTQEASTGQPATDLRTQLAALRAQVH